MTDVETTPQPQFGLERGVYIGRLVVEETRRQYSNLYAWRIVSSKRNGFELQIVALIILKAVLQFSK